MSGRTGLRRARVLLALTSEGQSVYKIAKATGLKYNAVENILDALSRTNLAHPAPAQRGWCLSIGVYVEAALAEARALVEAQGVEG